YTISGALTTVGTDITAPAGVELSLNQTTWSPVINIASTGGWGPITIYARIAASAASGPLAGDISHSSGTASATVSVSGTVNPSDNLIVSRNGPGSVLDVDNNDEGAGSHGL